MMEPVAAYGRVSGDKQAKEETIQTQRAEVSRYCQLHDLPVYDYYLDGEGEKGVTGMLPFEQRPEGSRLLADARAGRFREIVVYKTARLGRDFYETVSVLRLLKEQGLLVRSVTEHYDAATPDGRFMQGIHAIVAEKARADIVENSIAGCNRVAALGTWMGGHRPYGYRTAGSDAARRLVPDPEESEIVRQIYRWLVEDRWTCSAIARRLNALGIVTPFAKDGQTLRGVPSSGRWVTTRVRSLVANPLYKGHHTYGRKSTVRQPIVRSVPALVDEELWEAAQRQLDANMKFGCRNRKRRYLLSGKIRCSCGRTYVGIQQHRCRKLVYICKARNEAGLRGCSSPTLDAALVEDQIWSRIESFVRNPGEAIGLLAERLDERAHELVSIRQQAAAIVQRQEGKKRERQRLIDLYTSDMISREDYLLKYQRLNQEEADLAQEEGFLRQQAAVLENSRQQIMGAEARLQALNEGLGPEPAWEKKRELVELLLVEIIVSQGDDGKTDLDVDLLFPNPDSPLANSSASRSFIKRGCLCVRVRVLLAA